MRWDEENNRWDSELSGQMEKVRDPYEGREAEAINAVSSVENLHGDISYLENVLSMLNERLSPVVNRNVPRPAKVEDPTMKSDRPLYAELTGRVLDARERVRVIIVEVENLMRTIELP